MERIIDFLAKYPLFFRSKKKELKLGDLFMRTMLNFGAVTIGSMLVSNAVNYAHLYSHARRLGRIERTIGGKSEEAGDAVKQAYAGGQLEQYSGEERSKYFSDQEITDFVMQWQQAWAKSAYAPESFSDYISNYGTGALVETERGVMGLEELVGYKGMLNQRDKWRRVGSGRMRIERDDSSRDILVRYLQNYISSSYSDNCEKILLLRPEKEKGREVLKIVGERCI